MKKLSILLIAICSWRRPCSAQSKAKTGAKPGQTARPRRKPSALDKTTLEN